MDLGLYPEFGYTRNLGLYPDYITETTLLFFRITVSRKICDFCEKKSQIFSGAPPPNPGPAARGQIFPAWGTQGGYYREGPPPPNQGTGGYYREAPPPYPGHRGVLSNSGIIESVLYCYYYYYHYYYYYYYYYYYCTKDAKK